MDLVIQNIFSKINKNIFAGGIFGSRSRGAEAEHSDYDIILISPFKSEGDFYFLPENNLASATHRVCIFYRTPDQAIESLNTVDEEWSVRNAPFVHCKVVFDPMAYFNKFQDMAAKIDQKHFDEAFKETLYHAFEYLGKIRNNTDPIRTQVAVRRFTDKLCKATAIRNRHIYEDYCNYFPEIKNLEWVPAKLKDNMEGMSGFKGWDLQKIIQISLDVWDDYLIAAGITNKIHFKQEEHKKMSDDDIQIRQLTSDDWEVFKALRLKALREYPAYFMVKHFDEARKDDQLWRDELSNKENITFGAFHKGHLVGITQALKGKSPATSGMAISTGSYIEYDYRKSGVFKLLAEKSISWSKSQGLVGMVGSHRDENKPMVGVMKAFGFVRTGQKMAEWADGSNGYEVMYRMDFNN